MEATRILPARLVLGAGPPAWIALALLAGVGCALAAYAAGADNFTFVAAGTLMLGLAVWRLEYGLAAALAVAALGATEPVSSGSSAINLAASAFTSARTWLILLAVIEVGRALASGRRLGWPPVGTAAIAMLAAALLALMIAPDAGSAAGDFFVLAGSVAFFFLIALLIDGWERLKVVLGAIVAIGIVISLHALWQYATGNLSRIGFISETGAVEYRVASTFAHPNQLAGFLVVMVAVGVALYGFFSSRVARAACLALVGLAVLATVVTYSRGALLALLALPLVYAGMRRMWPLAVVAAAVIVLLAPGTWRDRVAGIGDTSAPEIASRLDLWEAAGDIFEERPVAGVGLDGYGPAYVDLAEGSRLHLRLYGEPVNAHNVYLNTLAEQGLIGGAALILLLAALIRLTLALWRSANPLARTLGQMIAGVGAVLVVHSIFDVTFKDQTTSMFIWALIGAAAAALRIARTEAGS
jgi:O-antigen ligase